MTGLEGKPRRRMHKLRTGDGPGVPEDVPSQSWPDMGTLEPFWETFQSFARSYLESPIQYEFILGDDGHWHFRALEGPSRKTNHRKRLTYDPEDDEIEFRDLEVDSGWVMEDAFRGDPTSASSLL